MINNKISREDFVLHHHGSEVRSFWLKEPIDNYYYIIDIKSGLYNLNIFKVMKNPRVIKKTTLKGCFDYIDNILIKTNLEKLRQRVKTKIKS